MQSLEVLRPSTPMDAIAMVLESRWLTPTIKSIWLELDQPHFHFLPGQSVWPKFERDGQHFSKIYSIASSPSHSPMIELCVSRVGWSSAYLQDLPIGKTISLRGPYGLLTLDRCPHRPRLYVVEGSGVAPLKSHLDWLYEIDFRHPLWLIQSNPETPEQLPYQQYWRSLCQRWTSFHYREVTTTSLETVLRPLESDLSLYDVDICAVGDRVDTIYETILSLGANPSTIRSEKFFAF